MTNEDIVILGKSAACDRQSFKHIEDEKIEAFHKSPSDLLANKALIQDSFVASVESEKSHKGTRKAHALKANLAKRKQQQRSRSLLSDERN